MSDKLMQEIEKTNLIVTTMVDGITKLTSSVDALVKRDIRSQEREENQTNVNERMGEEIKILKVELSDIKLARAEEAPSRKILMKYGWVLMVMGLAFTVWTVSAVKGVF